MTQARSEPGRFAERRGGATFGDRHKDGSDAATAVADMPRRGNSLSVIVAALACALPTGASTGAAEVPAWFAEPAPEYRPSYRYWLPGAAVDQRIVDADMAALAAHGAGGVEIADLPMNAGPIDPSRFGWGTDAWRAVLKGALRSAQRHGMRTSVTIGPAWPAVVPGLDPDSSAAAQELVVGTAPLGAAGSVAIPDPAVAPPSIIRYRHLVAVQAWRCSASCRANGPPTALDPDSMIDLTSDVREGHVRWRGGRGDWLLLTFWSRGLAEISTLKVTPRSPAPSAPQAYVPDHFGVDGARAIARFWQDRVLDPELVGLLRAGRGDMFEDSLELDPALNWTPSLLDEFARLRGYDLRRVLPLIVVRTERQFGAPLKEIPSFVFSDGSHRDAYRDYQRTLADLYVDNHLAPLKAWANSIGLRYRAQTYGFPLQTARAAATVDVPEGENLTLLDDPDAFRALAGAGRINGSRILSDECCALFQGGYRQTWLDIIRNLERHMLVGVNRVVLQGYPYSGKVPTAGWPGWGPLAPFGPSAFSPEVDNGFSENWGARQPAWALAVKVSDWFARTSAFLSRMQAPLDLLVIDDELSNVGPTSGHPEIAQKGYSYAFATAQMAAGLLVEHGGVRIGAATFRAVLTRQVANDPRLRGKLSELRAAGVPVIGDATGDVAAALSAAGIKPAADLPPSLGFAHGSDGPAHLYWIVNPGVTSVRGQVLLRSVGKVVRLDPWSGGASGMASVPAGEGETVTLDLAPGEAAALLVKPQPIVPKPDETREARYDQVSLDPWELSVISWSPDAAGGTRRLPIGPMHLTELRPWSQTSGLSSVSGIGSYSTMFRLPKGRFGSKLLLDIPPMADGWSLEVNGRGVPADLFARTIDLSRFARPGENKLRLTVYTTLNNALATAQPALSGKLPRQAYGVDGPVTLRVATSLPDR